MTIDEITDTNHKIAKLSGLPAEVHAFQERYNPLTFYTKLKEIGELIGILESDVKAITGLYEEFYTRIMDTFKYCRDRNEKDNM